LLKLEEDLPLRPELDLVFDKCDRNGTKLTFLNRVLCEGSAFVELFTVSLNVDRN